MVETLLYLHFVDVGLGLLSAVVLIKSLEIQLVRDWVFGFILLYEDGVEFGVEVTHMQCLVGLDMSSETVNCQL